MIAARLRKFASEFARAVIVRCELQAGFPVSLANIYIHFNLRNKFSRILLSLTRSRSSQSLLTGNSHDRSLTEMDFRNLNLLNQLALQLTWLFKRSATLYLVKKYPLQYKDAIKPSLSNFRSDYIIAGYISTQLIPFEI